MSYSDVYLMHHEENKSAGNISQQSILIYCIVLCKALISGVEILNITILFAIFCFLKYL